MSNETKNLIEVAVYLITLVVGALLLPFIRRWLTAKEGNEKADYLYGWVETLVKAAEQLLGAGTGPAKYAYVLKALQGFTDSQKIKLDETSLQATIEAAVLELKQGANQPAPSAVGNVVVAGPVVEQTKEGQA